MNDPRTRPPLVLASGPDDAGVAVLTLNRPEKKNALSIALREEAIAILGRLAGDEAVKALVITGSGGSFSAGFDLREFAVADPGHQERLWLSSDQFHHAVHRFPVPVIAAVDGVAYGGGFDLAVLCDLRIATHRAAFAHPETAQGPVVYGPLHDLVGGAIARELVLTGRAVGAAEALRLHLVTEVTGPGELTERALALAREVSRAPREVLLRNKAKFTARSAISPGTPTLDL
ncbi:MAG: enoyl-CoA hydratase/isomerase family protein [Streptosporangiaceae bacterium]